MKRAKEFLKTSVVKYGACIAAFAFAFVAISANTGCLYPFYEPEEPKGLERFKKIK